MRWCWNWQTGMVEGHVPQGVEVQVLSSAPHCSPGVLRETEKIPVETGDFLFVRFDYGTEERLPSAQRGINSE
jgi:hypothetical protein